MLSDHLKRFRGTQERALLLEVRNNLFCNAQKRLYRTEYKFQRNKIKFWKDYFNRGLGSHILLEDFNYWNGSLVILLYLPRQVLFWLELFWSKPLFKLWLQSRTSTFPTSGLPFIVLMKLVNISHIIADFINSGNRLLSNFMSAIPFVAL